MIEENIKSMKKLKKFGAILATTILVGTAAPTFQIAGTEFNVTTEAVAASQAPEINANAAFAIEAGTGKVLLNQNGDTPLGIASMTKMIVEYILFEAIEAGEVSWDQQVSISDYAFKISHDTRLSNVHLRQDETYSIEELYQSLAIYSANGSTIAIAEAIAGSEPAFVDLMREQLDEWGITEYQIYNATGLNNSDLQGNVYPGSSETDENTMTARGIAEVAMHLVNDYPEVLETTSIPKMTFREGTSDAIDMSNWNWMLEGLLFERENVDGLKTGTTDFAGASIAGTAKEDDMRIITIVMNAENGETDKGARFKETDKIMDWVFANWDFLDVYKEGDVVSEAGTVAVDKGKADSAEVSAGSDVTIVVPQGTDAESVTADFVADPELLNAEDQVTAPLKKGQEMGKVQVSVEGEDLGYIDGNDGQEVSAVATEAIEKANVFVLSGRWVGNFFSDLFADIFK